MDWARPQFLPVTVIPGVEHFFHGQLTLLKGLAARHLAKNRPVDGGEVVEGVGGGDPLATDPVAGVDADVGDLEHGEGLPRGDCSDPNGLPLHGARGVRRHR